MIGPTGFAAAAAFVTGTTTEPLHGVRVLDMATVMAAPSSARYLADFGAEVIKVEAPQGDPARRIGWHADSDPDTFLWKIVGRNKRPVTLDLSQPDARKTFLTLVDDADVLIENMRPGKLEKLGMAPEILLARNPRLVILRVTGFGQDGPYAAQPGFATIAEAMSGYANISGEADGGPLLPPIAITDEVAGIVGAFATMVALWHARETGEGQVVDVSLIETLLQLMGPLIPAYVHLGYQQPRMGSKLPWTVPRGTYECADGRWIALSASSDGVAKRLLDCIGVGTDERFLTFDDRMTNSDVLEELVTDWVGQHSSEEAIAALRDVDAAVGPVYSIADVVEDPHFRARNIFVEVDGVVMPNVVARLSRTPGQIHHAGLARSGEDVTWSRE